MQKLPKNGMLCDFLRLILREFQIKICAKNESDIEKYGTLTKHRLTILNQAEREKGKGGKRT